MANYELSPAYYHITELALSFLEKVLKVNIKLHATNEELDEGDIFLFNHFARFETAIPPYLIYRATGKMSRSITSPEFFTGSEAAKHLLIGLGAVPANMPGLMPFLAREIIRGRKVVIFPEGGMVKDRRVVDKRGRYSVFSRTAGERRKHHMGSAVLSLGVDIFKESVRSAKKHGNDAILSEWSKDLGEDGRELLLEFSEKETTIIPANITFYPIRAEVSLLERWAGLLAQGETAIRLKEELRIESNILFRDTDMDIRFGRPSCPSEYIGLLEKLTLRFAKSELGSLEEIFAYLKGDGLLHTFTKRRLYELRNSYMEEIYSCVSVNISHLASSLIYAYLEQGVDAIETSTFSRALYLAIKKIQKYPFIKLHRSVANPELYCSVFEGTCPALEEYLTVAEELRLVEREEGLINFMPRLLVEVDFENIRIENPIMVYANEVRPIPRITSSVAKAIEETDSITEREMALLSFDDELSSRAFDLARYSGSKHRELNNAQRISTDPRPFLLFPEGTPKSTGVILIHGFTASPAEMRPLGGKLRDAGYLVHGVRLKGHGTSVWDLKDTTRADWRRSVAHSRRVMGALVKDVIIVGFSTGALCALESAALDPKGVRGVVSAAAPLKLRDKAMLFTPLVHGINVLTGIFSEDMELHPFHESHPEHPEVNYSHIPISSLHELDKYIGEVEKLFSKVTQPVLVMQSSGDETVVPASGKRLYDKLGSEKKRLLNINSNRHGIIYENIDNCHDDVLDFIEDMEEYTKT